MFGRRVSLGCAERLAAPKAQVEELSPQKAEKHVAGGVWGRAWIEADNMRQEGQGRSSELMARVFISELRVDVSQHE